MGSPAPQPACHQHTRTLAGAQSSRISPRTRALTRLGGLKLLTGQLPPQVGPFASSCPNMSPRVTDRGQTLPGPELQPRLCPSPNLGIVMPASRANADKGPGNAYFILTPAASCSLPKQQCWQLLQLCRSALGVCTSTAASPPDFNALGLCPMLPGSQDDPSEPLLRIQTPPARAGSAPPRTCLWAPVPPSSWASAVHQRLLLRVC